MMGWLDYSWRPEHINILISSTEGLAGFESQPMSSHLSGAIFTLFTTLKYSTLLDSQGVGRVLLSGIGTSGVVLSTLRGLRDRECGAGWYRCKLFAI
jgi:hypothetical protein